MKHDVWSDQIHVALYNSDPQNNLHICVLIHINCVFLTILGPHTHCSSYCCYWIKAKFRLENNLWYRWISRRYLREKVAHTLSTMSGHPYCFTFWLWWTCFGAELQPDSSSFSNCLITYHSRSPCAGDPYTGFESAPDHYLCDLRRWERKANGLL